MSKAADQITSKRAWLETGQEVFVRYELSDGRFLVQGMLGFTEGDETWMSTGPPRIVEKVFKTPPVTKYHEEIRKLKDQLEVLRKDRKWEQNKLDEEKKKHEERMAQYAKYDQLKYLDDFIDGKIEWVALLKFRPEVKIFQDWVPNHGSGMRLMSLFGDSKGDLMWRVNDYRDGSGSWTKVIPCATEAEAKEKVKDHLLERLGKISEKTPIDSVDYIVKRANEWGVKVPKVVRKMHKEKRREHLEKKLSAQKETVANIEAELSELK